MFGSARFAKIKVTKNNSSHRKKSFDSIESDSIDVYRVYILLNEQASSGRIKPE